MFNSLGHEIHSVVLVYVSVPATGPAMSLVSVGMMFTAFLNSSDTVIRISRNSDRQDADDYYHDACQNGH